MHKRIADTIVVVHSIYIALMVASIPLVILFWWYYPIAVLLVAGTLAAWAYWHKCPLVVWENDLRRKYNPDHSYNGTFTGHYLRKYFSFSVSEVAIRTSGISVLITLVVLVIPL